MGTMGVIWLPSLCLAFVLIPGPGFLMARRMMADWELLVLLFSVEDASKV